MAQTRNGIRWYNSKNITRTRTNTTLFKSKYQKQTTRRTFWYASYTKPIRAGVLILIHAKFKEYIDPEDYKPEGANYKFWL